MASGLFGLVSNNGVPLSTVINWNLTETKTADAFVASNTFQGTQRGGGIRAWSGNFTGKGHTPPVMPNQLFEFEGYTSPTTGVEGTAGPTYSGPAICSGVTINWDFVANAILNWSADFVGLPGLTIADVVPTLDVSLPFNEGTCLTKATYEGATATEIPALTSIALNITAGLATEANSSTIFDGECWSSASAGPIDWTVALAQEDYLRGVSGYPDLGSDVDLRLYTDLTDYWQLKFGKVLDYSGLVVDRSGGIVIARTINIAMQASDGTTIGNIVLPGEDPQVDVYWGIVDP